LRVQFRDTPWDIIFVAGYTLATSGILIAVGSGSPLALPLVVFFPGYVVLALLFPGAKEISWTERLLLSVGTSLVVLLLVGLVLNLTPFGIRFAPIVSTLVVLTVLVDLAAYWRRMHLPPTDRLSATLDLRFPDWQGARAFDKPLAVALVVSILVALVAATFVVTVPRPRERYTEFYLLGPGGNASGYPTRLNVSEPANVIIGMTNHETVSMNYTVRVDLVGVQVVYNGTTHANETIELNRTTWSWLSVSLPDGRSWTQAYAFAVRSAGLWKIQFLLYESGSPVNRNLQLLIRVT